MAKPTSWVQHEEDLYWAIYRDPVSVAIGDPFWGIEFKLFERGGYSLHSVRFKVLPTNWLVMCNG